MLSLFQHRYNIVASKSCSIDIAFLGYFLAFPYKPRPANKATCGHRTYFPCCPCLRHTFPPGDVVDRVRCLFLFSFEKGGKCARFAVRFEPKKRVFSFIWHGSETAKIKTVVAPWPWHFGIESMNPDPGIRTTIVPLTYGSGSGFCFSRQWLTRSRQKISFVHQSSKKKVKKNITK